MHRIQILFTIAAGIASAQSFSSTLSGVISDQSGAMIAGAAVTATQVATNAASTATSDAEGRFVIPGLQPGPYRVSAEATGFKQFIRSGLRLEVDQRLRLDIQLELGAVSEKVEISADAARIEAETSSIGAIVDNRHVTNIPLNSRNAISLIAIIPGARPSRGFGNEFNSTAAFVINGGRGNSSEVLTDGISSTASAANPINTVPVAPPVEAIQEFKVQTNSLAAEYGRTGGGVLNFIYKSGTNDLHFTLFEFLRNSALDANNFFNNQRGLPLSSFRRNQFGGVVGGPVYIPKVINGRNRLFFFFSYDALRESTQTAAAFTFPTAAERSGDFSRTFRTVGAACQPVNIFDPYTTRANPAGGFIRTQFPGNVIPPSRLDPAGLKSASFYPLPNGPGADCSGANNFAASGPSNYNLDQYDFKIDFNPTDKDRSFVRLSPARRIRETPAEQYNTIGSNNRFRRGRSYDGGSGALSYSRIISPALIADARIGYNRWHEGAPPSAGDNFDPRAVLGFEGRFQEQMLSPFSFPLMTVAGYGSLGRGDIPFTDAGSNTYQALGNVTWIRGAHTIKTGADYRVIQSSGPNPTNTSGNYTFGPNFTQGPNPTTAGPTSGNAIASLLSGMGTGNIGITPRVFTSNRYFATYIQDDYKVSRRLTLNLGLRWDVETGRRDRYNHLSWFNFDAPSPLASRFPGLRGGLEFPGVNGSPRNQYDTDWNNFGPRFGFAYNLRPNTVVRGGYALYYEPFQGRAVSTGAQFTGFSTLTSWVSSLDGITPLNPFRNPFPDGLVLPPGSSQGLLTAVGEGLGATNRDGAIERFARVGYVSQWNYSIQQMLPGSLLLEVAYVGNKGTKLSDGNGWEINQLSPEALRLGNALLERVANPFVGAITSGTLSAATTTRGQLLRPYPHFTRLVNYRPSAASSIYHAFQLELNRRVTRGVQFLAAYTAGKLIDDSSSQTDQFAPSNHQNSHDRRADRSLSVQDISQRLALSYVVDLPWGWQINGITTFQTGQTITVSNGSDNSQSFGLQQRPNVRDNPRLSSSRPTSEKLTRWFDTTMFSQPAPFTFGNAGRVLPNVRSDGTANFDISLFKNFALPPERKGILQFRAEFFNAFNTPEFGIPGAAFGTPNFGVVGMQVNPPRQIQFGLKLIY
ncbi:MAG: TonB-dependent receptor [Acidobacteria bacterium]|nr:TonB-dependent receptor [Acidobacteriota bacterium]